MADALRWLERHKAPQLGPWRDRGIARVIDQKHAAGRTRAPGKPRVPPEYEVVSEADNPFDRRATYMALRLVYATRRIVAAMAAGSGASMRVAYATASAAVLALMGETEDDMRRMQIEPVSSCALDGPGGIWSLDGEDVVNWAALAEAAGEPVDLAAWEDHARKHWGRPEEGEGK